MENKISFKERVRRTAIENSRPYMRNLISYEYLVCSKAFSSGFKIVKADGSNYLHLIGINSNLTAIDFWKKCLTETLSDNDFDFKKKGQEEKAVKGSVRQKIQVLSHILVMFSGDCELIAEEFFHKNKVECAFATSDNSCTLGFAESGRPKSLMKSNELSDKAMKVDLIFRKPRNSKEKFTELCYGEKEKIVKYWTVIENLIDNHFGNF